MWGIMRKYFRGMRHPGRERQSRGGERTMTKEKIMATRAGKKLDAMVAETVMGNRYVRDETFGDMEITPEGINSILQPYSSDITAAWDVLERMKGYNPRLAFDTHSRKWEAAFSFNEAEFTFPMVLATTAPEAICKAALLALLETENVD